MTPVGPGSFTTVSRCCGRNKLPSLTGLGALPSLRMLNAGGPTANVDLIFIA